MRLIRQKLLASYMISNSLHLLLSLFAIKDLHNLVEMNKLHSTNRPIVINLIDFIHGFFMPKTSMEHNEYSAYNMFSHYFINIERGEG